MTAPRWPHGRRAACAFTFDLDAETLWLARGVNEPVTLSQGTFGVLGTMFTVTIVDQAGNTVVSGNGKVVAKQDLRIGLRLTDVPKEAVTRLQAEVAKLAPAPTAGRASIDPK